MNIKNVEEKKKTVENPIESGKQRPLQRKHDEIICIVDVSAVFVRDQEREPANVFPVVYSMLKKHSSFDQQKSINEKYNFRLFVCSVTFNSK